MSVFSRLISEVTAHRPYVSSLLLTARRRRGRERSEVILLSHIRVATKPAGINRRTDIYKYIQPGSPTDSNNPRSELESEHFQSSLPAEDRHIFDAKKTGESG